MSEMHTGSCRSCGQVFPEKESADAKRLMRKSKRY